MKPCVPSFGNINYCCVCVFFLLFFFTSNVTQHAVIACVVFFLFSMRGKKTFFCITFNFSAESKYKNVWNRNSSPAKQITTTELPINVLAIIRRHSFERSFRCCACNAFCKKKIMQQCYLSFAYAPLNFFSIFYFILFFSNIQPFDFSYTFFSSLSLALCFMLYLIILNAKHVHIFYVSIFIFSSSISFEIYDPKILKLFYDTCSDDVSYNSRIQNDHAYEKERSKRKWIEYQIEKLIIRFDVRWPCKSKYIYYRRISYIYVWACFFLVYALSPFSFVNFFLAS